MKFRSTNKILSSQDRVPKPRGRPVKKKGEPGISTREQLLDTTSDILTERGTIDVSFAEITKRSGLNAALIGYYFGNKAGLMMALLRRILGDELNRLEEISTKDISPEEKLRSHVSGLIMTYYRFPYINRLIHQLVFEDPETFGPLIAEEISKRAAQVQRHILDEGVAKGKFREIDPLHFYFHVIGASDQFFHGRYQMRYIFGVDEVNQELTQGYADYLASSLIRSLAS